MKKILVLLSGIFVLLSVCDVCADDIRSVITTEDIEKRMPITLSDMLREMYSLDIVQKGGTGRPTFISVRGAEPAHTLVFIDGVRVNSPTRGWFDFADLPAGNIESVEVIRGPLSPLYGPDAIGGIIRIFTKSAPASSGSLSLQGGSYGTTGEGISTGVKKDKYAINLTASRTDTDGISAANNGSERDGYENTTVTSHVGMPVWSSGRLDLTALLSESRTELDSDDFIAGMPADDNNYERHRRLNVLGMAITSPVAGNWKQRFSISGSNDNITAFDEDTPDNRYQITTGIKTVDWTHNIHDREGNQFTIGYEWQQRDGELKGTYSKSYFNHAIYLEDQRGLDSPVQLSAGIRWDESTLHESALTYHAGASFLQSENVRWHAHYGTGFKGPTLNDLFLPGSGNTGLRSEKSRSWEAGVKELLSNDISVLIDYYENFFADMILQVCDRSNNCRPQNFAEAYSRGIEVEIKWSLSPMIQVAGNYTYDDTEEKESHFYLPGRPLNKYAATIRLNPAGRWQMAFNLVHTGKRIQWTDTGSDGRPDLQEILSAYSRADLLGSYRIGKVTELFGRIENLFNKNYEEVKGYGTAGFSTYWGIRISI